MVNLVLIVFFYKNCTYIGTIYRNYIIQSFPGNSKTVKHNKPRYTFDDIVNIKWLFITQIASPLTEITTFISQIYRKYYPGVNHSVCKWGVVLQHPPGYVPGGWVHMDDSQGCIPTIIWKKNNILSFNCY